MKTKLINGTSSEIVLKEENSGVQRLLSKLAKKGDSYVLDVDVNATYKEYHIFETPSTSAAVIVSSDDLAEYEDITIIDVSERVCIWKGTPRKPDNQPAVEALWDG